MTRVPEHRIAFRRVAAALAFAAGAYALDPSPSVVAGPAPRPPAPREAAPRTDPDASVVAAFQKRLEEYVALHRKLEATLPRVPRSATPAQIDKNQRALGELIRSARRAAKQGEFFNGDMQGFVRRTLGRVFAGPEGKTLKASIMDENPGLPKLVANERYPDAVPLSTMPPEVLSALPKLAEDMEYRFVGESLVLFDSHAHLIVDFMNDALPV